MSSYGQAPVSVRCPYFSVCGVFAREGLRTSKHTIFFACSTQMYRFATPWPPAQRPQTQKYYASW